MNEVLKHSEAHITKTAYEYANVSAATWQVHFAAKNMANFHCFNPSLEANYAVPSGDSPSQEGRPPC